MQYFIFSVLDIRSQLLYVACKPLYVKLSEQTEDDLEELKINPSRYRTPTPEISHLRARSPSIEPVADPIPGDQNNPIVIDLDDDDEDEIVPLPAPINPTPMDVNPSPQPIQRLPIIATVATLAQSPYGKGRSVAKVAPTRRTVEKRPRSMPASVADPKSILVVDLISSDEEDENCDPMQSSGSSTPVIPVTEVIRVDPNVMCGSIVTSSKLLPAGRSWERNGWLSYDRPGPRFLKRKSQP